MGQLSSLSDALMPPLARSLLALIVATLVGALLIGGADALSRVLVPPPPSFSLEDPAQVEAYWRALPTWVHVLLLAATAVASLIAGGLAARLAPRHPARHALVAGILLFGVLIGPVLQNPAPGLTDVAILAIPVPLAVLGARWLERRVPT